MGSDAAPHEPDPAVHTTEELLGLLAERDRLECVHLLLTRDPLRLSRRVVAWMHKRCFLFDTRSIVQAAVQRVVLRAPGWRAEDDLECLLDAVLEDAGASAIRKDEQLSRDDAMVSEPLEPRFQLLAKRLRMEPAQLRRGVVAFNGLPVGRRHVLFHCLVIGKGFARYAGEVGIDARHARTLFRQAVDTISRAVDDDGESHG